MFCSILFSPMLALLFFQKADGADPDMSKDALNKMFSILFPESFLCMGLIEGDGKQLINKTTRHVHDFDNSACILYAVLNRLPGFGGGGGLNAATLQRPSSGAHMKG